MNYESLIHRYYVKFRAFFNADTGPRFEIFTSFGYQEKTEVLEAYSAADAVVQLKVSAEARGAQDIKILSITLSWPLP